MGGYGLVRMNKADYPYAQRRFETIAAPSFLRAGSGRLLENFGKVSLPTGGPKNPEVLTGPSAPPNHPPELGRISRKDFCRLICGNTAVCFVSEFFAARAFAAALINSHVLIFGAARIISAGYATAP